MSERRRSISGAPANRYGCAVTTAEPAPAEPAPAGKPPADVTEVVPFGLRVTAAFAWRLVVVAAAIGVVVWLIGEFALLATTLAIGLLLTALVTPLVELLVTRARFPRGLAVAVSVITGLALLGGVMTFVIVQFADGLPALQQRLNQSLDEIKNWLTTGPLAVETKDINEFIQQIFSYIQENQASITTSAITTAGAVGEFLTGFLLVLFILIFFLLHGASIWKFLLHVVPGQVRPQVDTAGQRGFVSLTSYVRATIVVAVVDAVGIGVGLAILGVPLVVPLATLVFLGAFVPIIGSLLAGSVAVLIALVTVGWVKALIALGVVTAVMQLEGHVLQPLLLGRAVRLHPLAVILAITGGLVVAGIAGALLAVPLLAVINAGVKSLRTTNSGEIPDPEAVESS
jgi:predicted PurR-regulated permease PerM